MLNQEELPPQRCDDFRIQTTYHHGPTGAHGRNSSQNNPSLIESDVSNSLSFDVSHSSLLSGPVQTRTQNEMIDYIQTVSSADDIEDVSHLLRFLGIPATGSPPSENMIHEAIKRGWSQAVELLLTMSSYR